MTIEQKFDEDFAEIHEYVVDLARHKLERNCTTCTLEEWLSERRIDKVINRMENI